MNWRRAWISGFLVLPFLVLLALGFGTDPHAVPFVLKGEPAPAFRLESLSGESVSLESYQGKPVVMNFWASWCEPCKLEHRLLQNAARRFAGEVVFLGVVYQDTKEAAVDFLNKYGNEMTQLLDPDSKTAIDYGVSGVPESFFINRKGQVVYKEPGVLTPERLFGELEKIMRD